MQSLQRHFGSAFVLAAALSVSLVCAGAPAQAQSSVESFYKGKTINLYVGFSPGGSYDFYPRLFAQYMGKYIPGHPTIVVQNMTGAGSLKAANYLYSVAPKDGTALGVVVQTFMLEEAFKTPGVMYKSADFNYIGRMTAVLETIIISGAAKAKNIEDARIHEVVAGGTGPTSPTEGYPRLLNAFAGTKFKVISGYPGTTNVMVALEAGEVDAVETSWSTVVRTKRDWLENKKISVLVQAALERSKDLPDVPTLVELGTTPEAKAALAFYTSSAAVSRALIATPGIPQERVKALRDAFEATTHDPQFLTDIARSQSEFDPASGAFLEDLAKTVAATPPAVVALTAEALRAK